MKILLWNRAHPSVHLLPFGFVFGISFSLSKFGNDGFQRHHCYQLNQDHFFVAPKLSFDQPNRLLLLLCSHRIGRTTSTTMTSCSSASHADFDDNDNENWLKEKVSQSDFHMAPLPQRLLNLPSHILGREKTSLLSRVKICLENGHNLQKVHAVFDANWLN